MLINQEDKQVLKKGLVTIFLMISIGACSVFILGMAVGYNSFEDYLWHLKFGIIGGTTITLMAIAFAIVKVLFRKFYKN